MVHSCDVTSAEGKRHQGSHLPRKASGSFKPRKPTPRRQTLSKPVVSGGDKEKLGKVKADELKLAKVDFTHLKLNNIDP